MGLLLNILDLGEFMKLNKDIETIFRTSGASVYLDGNNNLKLVFTAVNGKRFSHVCKMEGTIENAVFDFLDYVDAYLRSLDLLRWEKENNDYSFLPSIDTMDYSEMDDIDKELIDEDAEGHCYRYKGLRQEKVECYDENGEDNEEHRTIHIISHSEEKEWLDDLCEELQVLLKRCPALREQQILEN